MDEATANTPGNGAGDWTIDATHSVVEFAVRHVLVSTVKGWFPAVSGRIHYDPERVEESWVRAEIPLDSVTTHAAGRDEHLRGESGFDVARYPTATFVSSCVERQGDGTLAVTGDLAFHGVTLPITFATTFQGTAVQANGVTRAAFRAHATLGRAAFGFAPGRPLPGGGTTVADEVELALYLTCHPAEPS